MRFSKNFYKGSIYSNELGMSEEEMCVIHISSMVEIRNKD